MQARSRVVCARATISPPSAHTKIPSVALKAPVRSYYVARHNTHLQPTQILAQVPTMTPVLAPMSSPLRRPRPAENMFPPSMRSGARGAGESMRGLGGSTNRTTFPPCALRTFPKTHKRTTYETCSVCVGRVARVYVGRDRETGAGKGFAFVSFEEKANAQKAIDKGAWPWI